jgi:hypothetical protein
MVSSWVSFAVDLHLQGEHNDTWLSIRIRFFDAEMQFFVVGLLNRFSCLVVERRSRWSPSPSHDTLQVKSEGQLVGGQSVRYLLR